MGRVAGEGSWLEASGGAKVSEGETEGRRAGGAGIGIWRESGCWIRVLGSDIIHREKEFPAKAAQEGNDDVLCAGRALFAKHLTSTSSRGTAALRGGGVPLYRRQGGPEGGMCPAPVSGWGRWWRAGSGSFQGRPREGFAEPPTFWRTEA